MGIRNMKPANNDGDFEVAPAGTHAAVCVAVIELGLQEEEYQGEKKKQQKVMIVFQLVDEQSKTGKPICVGRDFTASLAAKANLSKFLTGWRGKPFVEDEEFDMTKLVGRCCLVSISHKKSADGSKTYAKLDSVAQPMKGQTINKPTVDTFFWEIDGESLPPTHEWLPRIYGIKVEDVISICDEYKSRGVSGQRQQQEEPDGGFGKDEGPIPF